jgi:hypothetical protein
LNRAGDNVISMLAYADHNFLIYCIKNPAWRETVVNAHRTGEVSLVLSPWHFYEYGNARGHGETEALLQFAEELLPLWTLERADLQLFEFWVVWHQLWESADDPVSPIGTLAEIACVLSKVHPAQAGRITIRDFVKAFSTDDALNQIHAAISEQSKIMVSNREAYIEGRFNKSPKDQMALKHLAVLRARWEVKGAAPSRVYQRADEILREQPISTQLQCFVDWGFVRDLKCYETEGAFTEQLYRSGGLLGVNRFVDRQHASIALPYCDRFVTDDRDLRKRCEAARKTLKFPTAEVQKGEAFIESLISRA